MKPRVMIIIATDIIGGPGKGIFQFLKNADHNEFNYTLFNFYRRGWKCSDSEFLNKARELNHKVQLLNQNILIDPSLVRQGNRIIKRDKIDIIQTHGYKSNILGFFLKLTCKIPWIAFAHGYTNDNLKVNLYNRLDSFVLRFADRVVAVSKSMKDLLINRGVSSTIITVIHNAVDALELVPNKGKEEIKQNLGIFGNDFVIGVIGRLGPEKGQVVFLDALAKLIKKNPKVKGLIIGEGPEKSKLIHHSQLIGLNRYVIFTGYKKNIANYFQIMDLLVIPSFSEGLPNVLLEALIVGIPVIATSVGGIPEVIKRTGGNLVPPGNPDRMAESIESLLRDGNKRWHINDKAKKVISYYFSPEGRANKIITLYYEMLGR